MSIFPTSHVIYFHAGTHLLQELGIKEILAALLAARLIDEKNLRNAGNLTRAISRKLFPVIVWFITVLSAPALCRAIRRGFDHGSRIGPPTDERHKEDQAWPGMKCRFILYLS